MNWPEIRWRNLCHQIPIGLLWFARLWRSWAFASNFIFSTYPANVFHCETGQARIHDGLLTESSGRVGGCLECLRSRMGTAEVENAINGTPLVNRIRCGWISALKSKVRHLCLCDLRHDKQNEANLVNEIKEMVSKDDWPNRQADKIQI